MKRLIYSGFLYLLFGVSFAQNRPVIGHEETVFLPELDLTLKARIDTGARTSSLSAKDAKFLTIEGEKWVRFRAYHPKTGLDQVFELPLVGHDLIKNRMHEKPIDPDAVQHARRPLVHLTLCIAGQETNIPVNLNDRRHFVYPFLLGRETMQQLNVMVDTTKGYLQTPTCPSALNTHEKKD